jgi:hypothetical protein
LPDSLTINASTGIISGNLTAAPSNYTVSVIVKDGKRQTASQNCTISILAPDPLSISTANDLGSAKINTSSSRVLEAAGGKPPYTWSFVSKGNLPPNANLTTSGNLTANSTAELTANFTVMVKEHPRCQCHQVYDSPIYKFRCYRLGWRWS